MGKLSEIKEVRPLLVLGSPRSGTTLIGNYVGSSRSVCNLGEYGGLYLSHQVAVKEYRGVPSPYKHFYIKELQQHAKSFPSRVASKRGEIFYCDSTPWNLLIAQSLAIELPSAVFIVTLRHYSGVLQSLQRSYKDGFQWATRTWAERAHFWCSFYEHTRFLPAERTIPLSYDKLCESPELIVDHLDASLAKLGVDTISLDRRQFAKSHATNRVHSRPTVGLEQNRAKNFLGSIPSTDLKLWDEATMRKVFPIVRQTDDLLKAQFPTAYSEPVGFSNKFPNPSVLY